VVNAASAALVLYLKGYGLGSIFRDSQRLVLILFLLSAALWAQIDFITIVLDVSRSPTSCQVGIIFSTVFDQFARFSIEQFLLWGLSNSHGAKLSAIQLIPQVLVLARFLAGAVFTGFTRPQTDTFCVATTSAPPVGFLVAALDGAIILLLIVRAYSTGGVAKENRDSKGNDADRARTLMSVLLGLVFWTGVCSTRHRGAQAQTNNSTDKCTTPSRNQIFSFGHQDSPSCQWLAGSNRYADLLRYPALANIICSLCGRRC
jgi:hypothetical protein